MLKKRKGKTVKTVKLKVKRMAMITEAKLNILRKEPEVMLVSTVVKMATNQGIVQAKLVAVVEVVELVTIVVKRVTCPEAAPRKVVEVVVAELVTIVVKRVTCLEIVLNPEPKDLIEDEEVLEEVEEVLEEEEEVEEIDLLDASTVVKKVTCLGIAPNQDRIEEEEVEEEGVVEVLEVEEEVEEGVEEEEEVEEVEEIHPFLEKEHPLISSNYFQE